MNVFKYGYGGFRGIHNISHNIKQFFRNIKFAYQRATRGFCDYDVWELEAFYRKLFIGTLTELKNISHGYPGTGIFEDEQAKNDGYENGYDRWQKYLSEIVQHFKNTDEDNKESEYHKRIDYLYREYQRTHSDTDAQLWLDAEKKFGEYRIEEKDIAMDMMKEYFFHLWD